MGSLLAVLPLTLGLTAGHPSPRPIVLVGGHSNTTPELQGWASFIVDQMDQSSSSIGVVELSRATVLGTELWPGTGSNETSANEIASMINSMYAANGNTPVDVVAVSQGALATRWLLQSNPGNIRAKVASVISFGGVNAGIPTTITGDPWATFFLDACEDFDSLAVCDEFMWDPTFPELDDPGETTWLMQEVNMRTPTVGDPTPGTIQYYHIHTSIDLGTLEADEAESVHPYGWSVPLLGATNLSAQQACAGTNPDRPAPHGGWWDDGPDAGTDPDPDAVLTELLFDALHHGASPAALSIDNPATTCQDQPGH